MTAPRKPEWRDIASAPREWRPIDAENMRQALERISHAARWPSGAKRSDLVYILNGILATAKAALPPPPTGDACD